MLQTTLIFRLLLVIFNLEFGVPPDLLLKIAQVDEKLDLLVACSTRQVSLSLSLTSFSWNHGLFYEGRVHRRRSIKDFSKCLSTPDLLLNLLFLFQIVGLLSGKLCFLLQFFLLLLAFQSYGVVFELEWPLLDLPAILLTFLRLIKLFLEYLTKAEGILVRFWDLLHIFEAL